MGCRSCNFGANNRKRGVGQHLAMMVIGVVISASILGGIVSYFI
ncbi:MAG: hypothetical protein V5A68_06160 [Candidatus Thermoplasmatota archaeon]